MNYPTILDIINVSYQRQQRWLFSALCCQLSPGQLLFIEGVNGSGKSTLLRLLAGYSTPTTGEVRWQGRSIYTHRAEYSATLHYVGHTNGIKLGLTVAENINLTQHLLLSNLSSQHTALLDEFELSAHYHQPAYCLSAGQKRRLALIKLCLYPKLLWILDEPFTSLDISTQAIFLLKLENHVKNGGIAIISSHQPMCFTSIVNQTLRLPTC